MTATIAFAHALGLEVTAEGIETQAQLERLAELGCDRGQGYLVGRSTTVRHVVELINAEDRALLLGPVAVRSSRGRTELQAIAG